MSDSIEIYCADHVPRRHFSITTSSLVMQLYRHNWTGSHIDRAFVSPWLKLLGRAAQEGDLTLLDAERLTVLVGERETIEIPVGILTSQYIGIDNSLPTFSRGYEPEVLATIDMQLPDDGTLLDIGTNWGYFTLSTALRSGFHGEIHSFEPIEAVANEFDRICKLLPLLGKRTLHRAAVSDSEGTVCMQKTLWSAGSFVSNAADPARGEEIVVPRMKIDRLGLSRADVVKMDVEGHELAVIEGASETLRRHRPVVIFENHLKQENLMQTVEPFLRLASLGYAFYCPGWVDNSGQIQHYPDPARLVQQFVLWPFEVEHRIRMKGNINFVALPTDRPLKGMSVRSAARQPWYFVC